MRPSVRQIPLPTVRDNGATGWDDGVTGWDDRVTGHNLIGGPPLSLILLNVFFPEKLVLGFVTSPTGASGSR
ncbi:MAG: hypothetical protein ABI824_09745, partial [Acidobacteriota bacterium]